MEGKLSNLGQTRLIWESSDFDPGQRVRLHLCSQVSVVTDDGDPDGGDGEAQPEPPLDVAAKAEAPPVAGVCADLQEESDQDNTRASRIEPSRFRW